MNLKNINFQCHCEPIALPLSYASGTVVSGAVGAIEAGRSNLLFDKKIDLLRGDCIATAPRRRFVATNAPRNDMNVRGVLL
jgi:hypothetical protein